MSNSSDPELIASDIDLIEGIYAATTQEGSLKEAARTFLSLQGDIGGAIFHYDSIAETPSGFEVFTSTPAWNRSPKSCSTITPRNSGRLTTP